MSTPDYTIELLTDIRDSLNKLVYLTERTTEAVERIAQSSPWAPFGVCQKHTSIPLKGDPHQSLFCPECKRELKSKGE